MPMFLGCASETGSWSHEHAFTLGKQDSSAPFP